MKCFISRPSQTQMQTEIQIEIQHTNTNTMFAGKDARQDGGKARGPGPGQPAQSVCSRPQCCWQVKHTWTGLSLYFNMLALNKMGQF